MTVEEIDLKLEELKKNNVELESARRKNSAEIEKLKSEREVLVFGKKPNCTCCRYSAGSDFTPDGWHNLCGNHDGACTCCHNVCEAFRPDTKLTEAIKNGNFNTIDWDKADALKLLGLYVYSDSGNDDEYVKKALKLLTAVRDMR